MKRGIVSLLFISSLSLMGCGSQNLFVKMNPYGKDVGFLSFEEKRLIRRAVIKISKKVKSKLPTKSTDKVWILSLEQRQDPRFAKIAHHILQTGFLQRGLWIGGKAKPAASLQAKGVLSLLSRATDLAGIKKGQKGLWVAMPPRDPFIDKLFMSLISYGNSDNTAHSTIEDNLIISLANSNKCTVLERDREVMLNLAAQYLVSGKLAHKEPPTELKEKLAIPNKILAYRISLLRKQLFKQATREAAGWPDRRANRVRRLWLQLHFRLIDTATSKIEWAGHFRIRVSQSIQSGD